ncbi:hypothetical protein K488DRAFT_75528 [Vararia minispora EC-137]|uniref:Uncharacterized protein n=1 Tax=Vararia minispora EC-137 TaxID=1314806 RepID=A0ACB8R098_9AGAM|nr:hypothetical protein K488DRAFT_75528 [Vararia minispora EC-137]
MAFFLEPPTPSSLLEARDRLQAENAALRDLSERIAATDAALQKTIADQHALIRTLQDERAKVQQKIEQARGYLAPIRRLPQELLRSIFLLGFDESPCCAWVLAAVCSLWRRLALSMPKLWSKIRLVTNPTASADTVRLWLERSGSREPLDIEITLQVRREGHPAPQSTRLRPRSPSPWGLHGPPHIHAAHYMQIHTGSQSTSIQILPASAGIAALPPSPPPPDGGWGIASPAPPLPPSALYTSIQMAGGSSSVSSPSRKGTHWGHIAIFYLVEQMHRWQRFIFRFDKQFSSWDALKSISGSAPLLEEFEVSCGEPFSFVDWQWLPCIPSSTPVVLPELRSLTLRHVPFKWSSPTLRNNLRSLTLQALPSCNLTLDRILYIVQSNRNLETLSLYFHSVLSPVLPLTTITLPELASLNVSGHFPLAGLLDHIVVPSLDSLLLDIEPRETLEETISALLTRSSSPPVRHLALGFHSVHGASYFYSSSGLVGSWAFLSDLPQLRTLHVGNAPLDPLFGALSAPEDDGPASSWLCPRLATLALKQCSAHGDGSAKLVQMVEGRNPEGVGSGVPARLKCIEMFECSPLGQDVQEWLRSRVEKVGIVEPAER